MQKEIIAGSRSTSESEVLSSRRNEPLLVIPRSGIPVVKTSPATQTSDSNRLQNVYNFKMAAVKCHEN